MPIPGYKSIGTASASAPTLPTGFATDDFAILVTENDTDTIATPPGWIAVPGSPFINTSGNNTVLQLWHRFLVLGDGNPAISASDHSWGVVLTYTGVSKTNPIHMVSSHGRPTSTDMAGPGIETYLPNCLILSCFSWHIASAGPLSSGETNSALSDLVERYDGGTTNGNGGGIVVIEGGLAVATTIGGTSITFSIGVASALACIALQDASQTFGGKCRTIMTGM